MYVYIHTLTQNPPTLVEASLDGSIVQSSQKKNQLKTMQQLSAERQRKIDLLKAQKETEKKLQVWCVKPPTL